MVKPTVLLATTAAALFILATNSGSTWAESTAGDAGQGQPTSADETPVPETPAPGTQDRPEDDEGVTASWDGGFYVRSSDGNFEFRPLAILHADFRWHDDARQINVDETLAATFDIRRLRLGFEGFLFEDS